MVKHVTDGDPDLISQKGSANHMKFFPAGTSFKTVDHFRQMLVRKRFAKYSYISEEDN